jgi:hypothetical protein
MAPIADNHPVMVAWNAFQETDDFKNSQKWASHPNNLQGSLWHMFFQGYQIASKHAADLYEHVDPASDQERVNNVPGAGAMGAVIEYRDLIRKSAST